MQVTSSPSRETSALQKTSRSSILRILSKTFLLTPASERIPWPEERPDLGNASTSKPHLQRHRCKSSLPEPFCKTPALAS